MLTDIDIRVLVFWLREFISYHFFWEVTFLSIKPKTVCPNIEKYNNYYDQDLSLH